MSFPQESRGRGCSSQFSQPITKKEIDEAEKLFDKVEWYNCKIEKSLLPKIVYRNKEMNDDIRHHVYRWDTTSFTDVFKEGFKAWDRKGTPEEEYYNLDKFVHYSGPPLSSKRNSVHAFVSTTVNSKWEPLKRVDGIIYRYEIYAPGGIDVANTLGKGPKGYLHESQKEVCFIGGIAPQYVRSALRYKHAIIKGRPRKVRADNEILLNDYFCPKSDPPSVKLLRLTELCRNDDGKMEKLTERHWPCHIDAAFRSNMMNEVYLFMKNEYVILDYARGKIVGGKPLLIKFIFRSIHRDKPIADHIDCAFRSERNGEAFIFCANHCAVINYGTGIILDSVLKGPMTIVEMFPFLRGSIFQRGIDAGFKSSKVNEAFIFKNNQFALIDCIGNGGIKDRGLITERFPMLKNTCFENRIDAAFASHRPNEAYLFNGDSCAHITTKTPARIIDGEKKIISKWPSLDRIINPPKQSSQRHM